MKTLPNGLPRYYADRFRDGYYPSSQGNFYTLRNSDLYLIIDRKLGFQEPIKAIHGAQAMERELARLNS